MKFQVDKQVTGILKSVTMVNGASQYLNLNVVTRHKVVANGVEELKDLYHKCVVKSPTPEVMTEFLSFNVSNTHIPVTIKGVGYADVNYNSKYVDEKIEINSYDLIGNGEMKHLGNVMIDDDNAKKETAETVGN